MSIAYPDNGLKFDAFHFARSSPAHSSSKSSGYESTRCSLSLASSASSPIPPTSEYHEILQTAVENLRSVISQEAAGSALKITGVITPSMLDTIEKAVKIYETIFQAPKTHLTKLESGLQSKLQSEKKIIYTKNILETALRNSATIQHVENADLVAAFNAAFNRINDSRLNNINPKERFEYPIPIFTGSIDEQAASIKRWLEENPRHPIFSQTYLNLSNLGLKTLPMAFIKKFIHLKELRLSNNNLSIISNNDFFQLKALQSLDLSSNKISFISENIRFLKNLKVVDFSHNKLEVVPKEVFDLPFLSVLFLNDNSLETLNISRPIKSRQLYLLEVLRLENNKLISIDDYFFFLANQELSEEQKLRYQGKLPNLRFLSLYGNNSSLRTPTDHLIQDKILIEPLLPK